VTFFDVALLTGGAWYGTVRRGAAFPRVTADVASLLRAEEVE
jgi:hypothetical protein